MRRIGIAPCHSLGDYVTSARDTGAKVIVMEDLALPAEEFLNLVDALVLTGGADVDPALYGAVPHASYQPAEPARDKVEIQLALGAMSSGMPLLAICRGIQVLNVAAGGTLVQDIPTEVPHALNHQVKQPRNAVAHPVRVEPDSLLARLLGRRVQGGTIGVNSRHHQAVGRLAPGFRVAATAPDGVIEAIESESLPFCLGVQWHPENFHLTGEFKCLFDGLLAAVGR
jgi:putative glutamine amidotransferase